MSSEYGCEDWLHVCQVELLICLGVFCYYRSACLSVTKGGGCTMGSKI
jgi:hypothetical protein